MIFTGPHMIELFTKAEKAIQRFAAMREARSVTQTQPAEAL